MSLAPSEIHAPNKNYYYYLYCRRCNRSIEKLQNEAFRREKVESITMELGVLFVHSFEVTKLIKYFLMFYLCVPHFPYTDACRVDATELPTRISSSLPLYSYISTGSPIEYMVFQKFPLSWHDQIPNVKK